MTKPRMFVGSSVENLAVAYAVQEELEHDAEVTVWSQGVFQLSRTSMENLMDALAETDFAAFVLSPDDVTEMRGSSKSVVRDNVVFELGLFIGRLGRERTFMLSPQNHPDFHLPTDLLGMTSATYSADRTDGNLRAALGPACNRIRTQIKKSGRLAVEVASADGKDVPDVPLILSDENDVVAVLTSWMGSRASSRNTSVMYFREIDKSLNLAPGSAAKYIETAARRWGYRMVTRGPETIVFQRRTTNEPYL